MRQALRRIKIRGLVWSNKAGSLIPVIVVWCPPSYWPLFHARAFRRRAGGCALGAYGTRTLSQKSIR